MIYLDTFTFVMMFITCAAASVLFHELGHLTVAQSYNKNMKVRFYYDSWRKFGFRLGRPKDYLRITKREYYNIVVSGLWMGTMPALVFGININPAFFLVIIPYITGCIYDFYNLWRNMRD